MIIYSYNNINGNSSQVIELLFLHFIYQVLPMQYIITYFFSFLIFEKYTRDIKNRIQIVKYEMDR